MNITRAKPKLRPGANSLDHETDLHLSSGVAGNVDAIDGVGIGCVFRQWHIGDADHWHGQQQSHLHG